MANNAKLALLRAKIDGQIQDLFIKTSFEHVIDSNNVALSTIIEGINTDISNLDTNKANKSDLGTLAAKNEVSEAELSASLATLISSKAAQADLNALQQTVDNLGALGQKDKIEYSDLAEALAALIDAKAEASALVEEIARAKAAEEANAAAIKAISDDYLKAADKTELSDAIKVISDDYLKAADKTELSNAIAAEKERAEGVEAGLQTQINTIMNNPDTEGVINSINEFTRYVADHGEIAEGFRTSIDANTQAISDKFVEATEYVDSKIGDIVRTEEQLITTHIVNTTEANYTTDYTYGVNEPLVPGNSYTVMYSFNNGDVETYELVCGEEYNYPKLGDHRNGVTPFTIYQNQNSPFINFTFTEAGEHWVKITNNKSVLSNNVSLSEEFYNELYDIVYGSEENAKAAAYSYTDNAIAALGDLAKKDVVSEADLDADLTAKVNASAEANHSHSNKDVLDGITAAKVSAWDASEQNAKDHATDLNTAMDTRVSGLETKVDTGDQTVTAYVTAAIEALSIGDYAKASELLTLAVRVETLETTSGEHTTAIEANANAIAALNIKANVFNSTPSDDDIAEGQMFIQLV